MESVLSCNVLITSFVCHAIFSLLLCFLSLYVWIYLSDPMFYILNIFNLFILYRIFKKCDQTKRIYLFLIGQVGFDSLFPSVNCRVGITWDNFVSNKNNLMLLE